MLYCLKHKVQAYKSHPCDIMSLVAITKDCKGIADRLYDLNIPIISASSFVYRATDNTSTISIDIDLQKDSLIYLGILGNLPTGWGIYTETVSADHLQLPITILGYTETVESTRVDARVKQVIKEFEAWLEGFDPQAIKSIATLMYS